MALPNPITISQEAGLIRNALYDYVTAMGGQVDVVFNAKELWDQTSLNSQSPRVIIVYNGENARGSFAELAPWHRVDRDWQVVVTRGRGYYSSRGSSLYDPTVEENNFYDIVESIRDIIRMTLTISEETPGPDYRSIKPFQMGNLVVDAYEINFSTANDIPSNLNQ